jgi:hypothetical protein
MPNFLIESAWLVVFAGKLLPAFPYRSQYGCLAVMPVLTVCFGYVMADF